MRFHTKHIGFIILFLITVFPCFPQSKFKVDISMGPVFPLGKFKSTDNSSLNSGYSKNGFSLSIDGDYYLHNRVSITGRFLFGTTTIDGSKFSSRLYNELSNNLPPIESSEDVKFIINDWLWAAPLLGIKYNYPIIINKFYFEIGAYTGVSFNQIPDQNLYYHNITDKHEILSQNIEQKDISIPLVLDGCLRYKINERIQFKISAEYFNSRANYTHISYMRNEGSTELHEINKNSFSVLINTLSLRAGLIYNL